MINLLVAASTKAKGTAALGIAVLACITVLAAPAFSGQRSDDPLGIAVSPQTFILGQEQGSVSVHTDLPFSQVDKDYWVTLNGVAATGIGADSCGDLVAKFDEAEIEAIVAPPSAVLTLEGQKTDGTPFSGSDTVRVIVDPRPE
ncbi:hypothetical protein JW859_03870 [bacterium]|nr:hypothetical protein [bacterium]